jgi:ABC-type nitrate/sulfonate/bicarbonate transport system ATPase subunit
MNIKSSMVKTKPRLILEAEAAHMDPARCVVAFEKVTKRFGGFTAVKDVTFRVYDRPDRGEFICVLGPSGCGKSTVLNQIAGFYGPTEGQVLMFGKPVGPPGADRGFVFQSYGSFPQLRVWENIAFGLKLQELNRKGKNPLLKGLDAIFGVRGGRRRRIQEEAMHWVKLVGLDGSEDKYPHQLSGGMRQRVALARTLAVKPKIILMDEPFGALDRVTRWEMQDLLMKLWREKEPTVFLVTHDIPEAVYLGDRIYIFSPSPGTIIEEVDVPCPDAPAAEMQRTTEFSELVNEISRKVELVLVRDPKRAA